MHVTAASVAESSPLAQRPARRQARAYAAGPERRKADLPASAGGQRKRTDPLFDHVASSTTATSTPFAAATAAPTRGT